jgi:hypothetical protein
VKREPALQRLDHDGEHGGGHQDIGHGAAIGSASGDRKALPFRPVLLS